MCIDFFPLTPPWSILSIVLLPRFGAFTSFVLLITFRLGRSLISFFSFLFFLNTFLTPRNCVMSFSPPQCCLILLQRSPSCCVINTNKNPLLSSPLPFTYLRHVHSSLSLSLFSYPPWSHPLPDVSFVFLNSLTHPCV